MRSALAAGGAAHRPGGARQAVLAARAAALSSALFSVRGSAASPPPPGGGGSAQGAAPVRAAAGAHRRVSSRAASAATPSCPQASAPNTRACEPAQRRASALRLKSARGAPAPFSRARGGARARSRARAFSDAAAAHPAAVCRGARLTTSCAHRKAPSRVAFRPAAAQQWSHPHMPVTHEHRPVGAPGVATMDVATALAVARRCRHCSRAIVRPASRACRARARRQRLTQTSGASARSTGAMRHQTACGSGDMFGDGSSLLH